MANSSQPLSFFFFFFSTDISLKIYVTITVNLKIKYNHVDVYTHSCRSICTGILGCLWKITWFALWVKRWEPLLASCEIPPGFPCVALSPFFFFTFLYLWEWRKMTHFYILPFLSSLQVEISSVKVLTIRFVLICREF